MQIKEALFKAFREDHAKLGGALYTLRTKLAASDIKGARETASEINTQAGAHIAFEEEEFYPALRPFLSASEVDTMYQEHTDGLNLISDLIDAQNTSEPANIENLIERVEKLEAHVSDCGELFGAMGGLDESELARLWERLRYWRQKAPKWLEFSAPQANAP